jgi:hypothetical protein
MTWAARVVLRPGSLLTALACAALGACVFAPTPSGPPAPSPGDACRALTDSLTAAVPPGESLAELQARGVRVRTPLSFPPGAAPRPAQPGGAVVQLMINPDGSVVPGSPKTVKSIGEAQIASAMEAAALSMSFEFEPGAKPAMPIPFTTTYAVCLRS